jgi:ATP-dependent helicase/nuclease subunit A
MAEQQYLKQQQATCPQTHTWVDASAGTGKTKILTDLILRLLLNDTPPSNIIALTFTKAAATEMKSRILDVLSQWAILDTASLQRDIMSMIGCMPNAVQLNKARSLFTEVLDCPGGLKIQTIHHFCQELLHRFPLEARIPLNHTLLNENEARRLLDQIINRTLYAEDLSLILQHYSYAYLKECLLEILTSTTASIDIVDLNQKREALQSFLQVDLSISPSHLLSSFLDDSPDWQVAITILNEGSPSDQRLADRLKQPRFYDQYLTSFLTQDGTIRKHLLSKKIDTSYPHIAAQVKQEAERIYDFNKQLRHLIAAHFSYALYHLAAKVNVNYQKHKEEHAMLDFDDLIIKTNHLLNTPGISPWILYKLDYQIDHILVDEAQDTNPLQWQIILKLTEDFFAGQSAREIIRTVFVVGDYKQSIYSFQGADPKLFLELKQIISEKAQLVKQRWQNISLDVSFRSCQAILDVVDAVFAPGDVSQGVHVGNQTLKHKSNRPLDGGKIEFWPLVKELTDEQIPYPAIASQTLARQLAAEIKQWLKEKRQIPAKGRSLEPQDIMILVQRRHAFMYDLIRNLKKNGIPVAGPDRMYLLDQVYIQDLLAFGRFLLLPSDDYSLACLLKSPLFNFSEEDLFELCAKREDRTLWAYLNQQSPFNSTYKRAQEMLIHYLNKVDYLTPFEMYAHLLGVSHGRQQFFARFGEEIADGLDEFLNLALNFESRSSASLELFLAEFVKQDPEIKRDFSNSDINAVRITTVHGAKGLEAPIVILSDTTFVPKTLPPLLWTELRDIQIPLWNAPKSFACEPIERVKKHNQVKQEEEYRRLLYVALTRAEDELYICGWVTDQDPARHCWYTLIQQGMLSLGAKEHNNRLIIEYPQRQSKIPLRHPLSKEGREEIPPWLFNPAKQEKVSTQFLSPSKLGQDLAIGFSPLEKQSSQRYQMGRVLHKLLELLANTVHADRQTKANQVFREYNLSMEKRHECYQLIEAILDDPQFHYLFGSGSYAEVPIAGQLRGEKYSGQIDRLVIRPEEIIIIDFKSDQHPPQTADLIDSRYCQQLLIYKQLLQQIYPHHKIFCQILWIRAKSLMSIPEESEEIRHAAA